MPRSIWIKMSVNKSHTRSHKPMCTKSSVKFMLYQWDIRKISDQTVRMWTTLNWLYWNILYYTAFKVVDSLSKLSYNSNIWRINTINTKIHHLTWWYIRAIHFPFLQCISLKSTLISPLPRVSFSVFQIVDSQEVSRLTFFSITDTCSANHDLPYFITLTILADLHRSQFLIMY